MLDCRTGICISFRVRAKIFDLAGLERRREGERPWLRLAVERIRHCESGMAAIMEYEGDGNQGRLGVWFDVCPFVFEWGQSFPESGLRLPCPA